MNLSLCEQLQLSFLISTCSICESSEAVISKKAKIVIQELKNMEKLLHMVSKSGTVVHEVANVRQILIGVATFIEKKGYNSKAKKKTKEALDRAHKILQANKENDNNWSKHTKNRKYTSVVSTFHNMY